MCPPTYLRVLEGPAADDPLTLLPVSERTIAHSYNVLQREGGREGGREGEREGGREEVGRVAKIQVEHICLS